MTEQIYFERRRRETGRDFHAVLDLYKTTDAPVYIQL